MPMHNKIMVAVFLPVVAFTNVSTAWAGNGLVADTGRAAGVEHPAPKFAGRDFCYFLTPLWHEIDGVKDEELSRNSGAGTSDSGRVAAMPIRRAC